MTNQTINLTPSLYQYLLDTSVRETEIARNLRLETSTLPLGHMQTSPDEANFLGFLIKLMQAKRVIEIGTFTGYGTLHMAMALPEHGKIITCDIDKDHTNIAKRYWQQAGIMDKIDLKLAPAEETLKTLLHDNQQNSFDFAFIDANKARYVDYYESCLQLVRPGGCIAIDNVLWYGDVINDSAQDNRTKAIRLVNLKLSQDARVDISMLAIGDGLFLVMKR